MIKSRALGHFYDMLGHLFRAGVQEEDLNAGLAVMGGHLIDDPNEIFDSFTAGGEQIVTAAIREDGVVAYVSAITHNRVGLFVRDSATILAPKPITGGRRIDHLHFPDPDGPPACMIRRGEVWHAQFGQWSVPTILGDENRFSDENRARVLFYLEDDHLCIVTPTELKDGETTITTFRHNRKTEETNKETFVVRDYVLAVLRRGDRNLAIVGRNDRQELVELKTKDGWYTWGSSSGRIEPDTVRIDRRGKLSCIKRGSEGQKSMHSEDPSANWKWFAPHHLFGKIGILIDENRGAEGHPPIWIKGCKLSVDPRDTAPEKIWDLDPATSGLRGWMKSFSFPDLLVIVGSKDPWARPLETKLWLIDPETGHCTTLEGLGLCGSPRVLGNGLAFAKKRQTGIDREEEPAIANAELVWVQLPMKKGSEVAEGCRTVCAPLYGDLASLVALNDGRAMGWHCVGHTFRRTIYGSANT